MIFTDKFVYAHKPKTGGTFVTEALRNVYEAGAPPHTPIRPLLKFPKTTKQKRLNENEY